MGVLLNKVFFRALNLAIVFVLMWSNFIIFAGSVRASSMTSTADVMNRLKISATSNHTITSITPSGVDAPTDTVTVEFDSGAGTAFDLSALSVTDIDLEVGDSNDCSTANFTDKTLGVAANVGVWGVDINTTTDIITFTAPTDSVVGEIASDRCIRFQIGTNADFPTNGSNRIINPSSAGSYMVVLGGTFGDAGSLAVGITADDQVAMNATISPSITFDIDSGTTQGIDNAGPHSVTLGVLDVGNITTSNQTSINSIFLDLDTNATFGASVTVIGTNGGLKSVAADPDKTITLASGEEALVAGTEGFGLCIESLSQVAGGPLLSGVQYDAGGSTANCTPANGGTPTVGRVETTATEILNTSSEPVQSGRAEVLVKAAISATTPAASDYSESLTFVVSGTF